MKDDDEGSRKTIDEQQTHYAHFEGPGPSSDWEIETGGPLLDESSIPDKSVAKLSLIQAGERPAPVIDARKLVPDDVTSSGSFDLRGIREAPAYKLLEALPIPAMFLDRFGKVSFTNRACDKIIPGKDAVLSRAFVSLFPDVYEAQKVRGHMDRVLQYRTSAVFEADMENGEKRTWARVHLRSLRMGEQRAILVLIENLSAQRQILELTQQNERIAVAARDELDRRNELLEKEIADRTDAEKKIEVAKREWERTFDSVSDSIAVLDADYRIVRMNRAMAEKLGISFIDAIGKHCYELFHVSDRPPLLCPNAQLFADGQTHTAEIHEDRLDAVFEISVSPLCDETGRLIGSVHVARDITDRKRAEKLLLESGRSKAVSELAGVVAHGLSNWMQIVMGSVQLALTNLELGNVLDTRNNLEQILENSRVGAVTLKHLNYVARADAETPHLDAKTVDLSRAVHQALDIARPWWQINPERAGIRIVVNRNLGPGCFVTANENELFEVVINLIKNAVEALPNGGTINVKTFLKQDSVFLEVQDGGIGISKKAVSKIFEPFWTTKGPQGTGMGLARARNIVEKCGGTIAVESTEGSGTTVTVVLKRTEARQGETAAGISEELGPALNLLVVDDSESVARMLRDSLTTAGHRVFTALSGRKAVEIFTGARIDAVLSDLEMPEMDGWQVARAVKDVCIKKAIPKPPFILLTGWGGQNANQEKMAECGVDQIIEKPVEISSLLRAVRSLARRDPGS